MASKKALGKMTGAEIEQELGELQAVIDSGRATSCHDNRMAKLYGEKQRRLQEQIAATQAKVDLLDSIQAELRNLGKR